MIASLGLISNSTAVVIGAMIVATLMDPILSLAFGLAISDGKLIRRSAFTIGFGVLAVNGTAARNLLMQQIIFAKLFSDSVVATCGPPLAWLHHPFSNNL